jgi:uncharacterized protein YndB with AHSA1/START domain
MATSESNLILVVTRVFKTDPGSLFDAWTKPELMKQWFHALEGWTTPVAEADLRIGGAWRVNMQRQDGKLHPHFGNYKVIEKPAKLAFTWYAYDDRSYETLVTLRFKGLSNGTTELTLTHEGLRTDKHLAEHNGGWNGCLDSLVQLVNTKEM